MPIVIGSVLVIAIAAIIGTLLARGPSGNTDAFAVVPTTENSSSTSSSSSSQSSVSESMLLDANNQPSSATPEVATAANSAASSSSPSSIGFPSIVASSIPHVSSASSEYTYVSSASLSSSSAINPVISNTPACHTTDLTVSINARASSMIAGTLIFTNQSTSNCSVSGFPTLAVKDTNGGTLPLVLQQSGAASSTVLEPKQTAAVQFSWKNWCQGVVENPFLMVVRLPGKEGYLSVPVQSGNGDTLTNPPQCTKDSAPSTLTTGSFGY